MTAPQSARSVLRSRTAPDHERVDRAFSRFDITRTDGYRAFLNAQAGPLSAIEAGIDAFDPVALLPDWPERRRAHLIRADLAELGDDIAMAEPFEVGTDERALGAIYVLEGSRLGGAMLARSVPRSLPGRFIRSQPAPQRWRELIAVLDRTLVTDPQRDAAAAAARAAFDLFARSALPQGRMMDVE